MQEAEAEKSAQEGRQNQERKCEALLEAVQLWREKKMEAWILEQVSQESVQMFCDVIERNICDFL